MGEDKIMNTDKYDVSNENMIKMNNYKLIIKNSKKKRKGFGGVKGIIPQPNC